ncbi:DUF362 domain-containing protein [Candidatus Riflebacteria bacterium]
MKSRSEGQNKISKIRKLFDRAGFPEIIEKNSISAIKIHFGERGNDSYINPVYVRQVVDKIKESGGKPFITDTNTLYSGSRHNSVDHLNTAYEHGFVPGVVGAPLIIADGLLSRNATEVEIEKKHFKKVQIARDIADADNMIVLTHFKGHMLSAFGGAIKNIAMGCTSISGKMQQHSARPEVVEVKCRGCGMCYKVCPSGAIQIANKKASVQKQKCTGCGECMTVCSEEAFTLDWATEIPEFLERMTESALGAINNKKEKVGYINFLMDIVPDCDCCPWSDAPIVPDIGILASKDPVALDKASYDLVNQQAGFKDTRLQKNFAAGKDKFRGVYENINGLLQITYGEEIGLGSAEYNLIEV